MRASENPSFYRDPKCSMCGGVGLEVKQHEYSDIVTCVECINKMFREAEEFDPQYEIPMNYNQLAQERNQ